MGSFASKPAPDPGSRPYPDYDRLEPNPKQLNRVLARVQ